MTFYGDDQVRAVREATDLVQLWQERTKVVKAGSDYVACCPLHGERTPSLHIYTDQGRWYCFGCKEHGDAIDVVRKLDQVDFHDAVAQLARRAGIQLRPQGGAKAQQRADDRSRRVAVMEWAAGWFANLWACSEALPARTYMAGRGFTDETIDAFQIGWAPGHGQMVKAAQAAGHSAQDLVELDLALNKDGRLVDRFFERITIPIRDRRGQVVGFTARVLPEKEAAAKAAGRALGKYVNTRDTPLFQKGEILFNLRGAQAGRRSGRCFVVEGPLDVMASYQAGVPEVVATLGTALTAVHAQTLRAALGDDALLVVALDGDLAGRRASRAALSACLAAGLLPHVGQLPGGKDAGALLQEPSAAAAVVAPCLGMDPADQRQVAAAGLRLAWDCAADSADDPLRAILAAHPCDDDAGDADRLAICDDALAVLAVMPDADLAELWLQPLADAVALPLRTVRNRWKSRPAAGSKPVSAGESAPAAQGGGEVSQDYRSMVLQLDQYLAGTGARPDAMCGWIDAAGNPADLSDGDAMLRFSHQQRMASRRIIDQELKAAMTVIVSDRRDARRRELLSGLIGQPATDAGRDALRRWVKGTTGSDRDLDVAVITHFTWQVKRLAAGLPTDWDIIPVLFGDQGLGKTYALEVLCRPLAELSFPIDASAITDERKSLVVTRALVGRLEEMAGMAKADAEKLKAMATARFAVFRELYTMSVQQRRRTCSFIASSNLPIDAIIRDTTGVRRFYQITCTSKDWDLINSLDPAMIWQAASETDEAPIKPYLHQLRAAQQLMLHHDVVALWLRSDTWQQLTIRLSDAAEPMIIQGYNPEIGYRLDELAARCAHWVRGTGNTVPPLTTFKVRLHQERFDHRKVSLPGKAGERRWAWFIPDRYRGGDDRMADLGGVDASAIPEPAPSTPKEDFP